MSGFKYLFLRNDSLTLLSQLFFDAHASSKAACEEGYYQSISSLSSVNAFKDEIVLSGLLVELFLLTSLEARNKSRAERQLRPK